MLVLTAAEFRQHLRGDLLGLLTSSSCCHHLSRSRFYGLPVAYRGHSWTYRALPIVVAAIRFLSYRLWLPGGFDANSPGLGDSRRRSRVRGNDLLFLLGALIYVVYWAALLPLRCSYRWKHAHCCTLSEPW